MSSFVLVHGVAHGAWCWERTVDALSARGHDVVAVDLPLTTLADDAAHVADVLDGGDGPFVLVGHSYGGLVISRAAVGRADVAHLVYVAAVLLDADDVYTERAADFPATAIARAIEVDGDSFTIPVDAAIDGFYNACDPADAAAAACRLRRTGLSCLSSAPGGEPWRDVASTYILCERDRAVPAELQRWMATRAGRVVVYDTDHSPFLSMSARFVDDLVGIAATV